MGLASAEDKVASKSTNAHENNIPHHGKEK